MRGLDPTEQLCLHDCIPSLCEFGHSRTSAYDIKCNATVSHCVRTHTASAGNCVTGTFLTFETPEPSIYEQNANLTCYSLKTSFMYHQL
jgi:hypothetical protein